MQALREMKHIRPFLMSVKPKITSWRCFHQPVQAKDLNDLEKSYCRIAHKNGQIKVSTKTIFFLWKR